MKRSQCNCTIEGGQHMTPTLTMYYLLWDILRSCHTFAADTKWVPFNDPCMRPGILKLTFISHCVPGEGCLKCGRQWKWRQRITVFREQNVFKLNEWNFCMECSRRDLCLRHRLVQQTFRCFFWQSWYQLMLAELEWSRYWHLYSYKNPEGMT